MRIHIYIYASLNVARSGLADADVPDVPANQADRSVDRAAS